MSEIKMRFARFALTLHGLKILCLFIMMGILLDFLVPHHVGAIEFNIASDRMLRGNGTRKPAV